MKIFKVLFVLIILGILGFVLFSFPPVQDRLVRNIFQQMTLEESLPSEDSLSAIVCGSRSPLPHPSRDGTCILVIAGDDLYVVDTGVGSANNLLQWRIPFNKIKAVYKTTPEINNPTTASINVNRVQPVITIEKSTDKLIKVSVR